jgi:uroporphyrinogen decarboxylase
MTDVIRKTRDFYTMKKNAPILQNEFGFFVYDRWVREGHIKDWADLYAICNFDPHGIQYIERLGWCEAAFSPYFEVKVLEDRGEYELVQDHAGRHVLFFKGRRNGFMPEYVAHPVKDWDSWERDIKWRMDAKSAGRAPDLPHMERLKELKAQGGMVGKKIIGGYMYLRALVGPEDLLYMVYDDPALVHDMMKTWFDLADPVIAAHQHIMPMDELFIAEDICYNCGPLISPAMIREFLFPYYQQLIINMKARQPGHDFFIQVDTDGDCRPVIPVYQELGTNYFSPFEVASGCDVVALRKQYPDLLMRGGIDKRILAAGKDAIDREVERIMPFMTAHGGYIPMCDHGVPEEVDFEDYMHYRKRIREF